MKKLLAVLCALAMCFALAACGENASVGDGTDHGTDVGSDTGSDTGSDVGSDVGSDTGSDDRGESGSPEEELASPLAALETIDLETAFEGKSGMLALAADFGTGYSFRWTSGVSGREKFFAGLVADIALEDKIGIEEKGLVGGGNITLGATLQAPSSEDEPLRKEFEAGIVHDGEWVVYSQMNGDEGRISIGDIGAKAEEVSGALSPLYAAVTEIFDTAAEGGTLRLGVERLLSLGFTAVVDTSDGVRVHLAASKGFFTDLLNDMLERFLPEDWLPYIPRADFRYTSNTFDITLAFDAEGKFEEYTVESNVDLGLSLQIRGLFTAESGMTQAGGFSIRRTTA